MQLSKLQTLDCTKVRTWAEIEAMRKALNVPGGSGGGGTFSRAEMCRRAGIDTVTAFKGIKKNARPRADITRTLRRVLEMRRHQLIAELYGVQPPNCAHATDALFERSEQNERF